jgi:hypothetical protein
MRRKLDEVGTVVSDHLRQRDDLTMVVSCRAGDLAVLSKILERVRATRPDDLVIACSESFVEPAAYVAALVAEVSARIDAANALRAEKDIAPAPTLPPVCSDPRAPSDARLVAMVDALHAHTPAEDGLVVLVLIPLAIHDQLGWARLMAPFLDAGEIHGWMRQLRVLARDDRDHPALVPAVDHRRPEGVVIYELDLSTATLVEEMARDAVDPSVPKEERMTLLLQLAAIDFGYQRFEDATAKYRIVFEHFAERGQPLQQAMCLEGVASVLRRVGSHAQARARLQQALVLATSSGVPMAMLNVLTALGEVCLDLGQPADAAGYLELADAAARRALQPYARCDVLERIGEARWLLDDWGGAIRAWTQAAELSRQLKYVTRWLGVEQRLVSAFSQAGMENERSAAADRVLGLRELVRRMRAPGCDHHGGCA